MISIAVVALLVSLGVLHGVWILAGLGVALLLACAPLAFGRPEPRVGDDRFEVLVVRCRQDRELAERLVAGESRRNPKQSRARWIQHAIDRLDSDRR